MAKEFNDIKNRLVEAIDALDQQDFATYLSALEQCGRKLRAYETSKTNTSFKQKLYDYFWPETRNKKLIEQQNYPAQFYENFSQNDLYLKKETIDKLGDNFDAFLHFDLVWRDFPDDSIDFPQDVSNEKRRLRSLKKGLNLSTRHNIKLALLLLGRIAVQKKLYTKIKNNSEQEQKAREEREQKIREALENYLTSFQKCLYGIGYFLSILFALGFAVTVGGAFVGTLFIFSANMPLAVMLVIFGLSFLDELYANFMLAKKELPILLVNLFGKDRLFEGLTDYLDKDGKKKALTGWQKVGLFFGFLIGLGGAATNGILAYIGTLELVEALPFLAPMASTLPIFGFVLFVLTTIALTALFAKDISEMLQMPEEKSFFEKVIFFFKKPFQEGEALIESRESAFKIYFENRPDYLENQKRIQTEIARQRALSQKIFIALMILATIGLAGMAVAGAVGLVSTFGALTPAVICGVLAFVGEWTFIVSSMSKLSARLAGYFGNTLSEVPAQETKTKTLVERLMEFFMITAGCADGITSAPELISTTASMLHHLGTVTHTAKMIAIGPVSVATVGMGAFTAAELMSAQDDGDPYAFEKQKKSQSRLEFFKQVADNQQKNQEKIESIITFRAQSAVN